MEDLMRQLKKLILERNNNNMINDLVKRAHENSLKHGFWEDNRNFGEVIALIHSELSEAFEEYRNGKKINETYYEEGHKPCGIPSELADVVIRIFDFCGGNDIDLEKIILEKMNYNETRPYKHNKKC